MRGEIGGIDHTDRPVFGQMEKQGAGIRAGTFQQREFDWCEFLFAGFQKQGDVHHVGRGHAEFAVAFLDISRSVMQKLNMIRGFVAVNANGSLSERMRQGF